MKWIPGIILLTFLIFFSPDSNAQHNRKRFDWIRRNAIDITYGGTGLFLSGNYSRKVLVERDYFLNASVGGGTIMGIGGITLPHQCTFNYGRRYDYIEAGIGGSFWKGKNEGNEGLFSYSISPIIGYRRDMLNDFVFRIYANPLFRMTGEYFFGEKAVVPYAGISLGYYF